MKNLISERAESSTESDLELYENEPTPEEIRQTLPKEEFESVLWTAPKDNGGWKEFYSGDIPVYDALKIADPELFDKFEDRVEEGAAESHLLGAYLATWEDVRQGTISPMAAAELLSRAYKAGGEEFLARLYSKASGNLTRRALQQAQEADRSIMDVADLAIQHALGELKWVEDE